MRNEGSRVRTTSQPLMAPRMSASANVSTTATRGVQPGTGVIMRARKMLVMPIMEPSDRSNSPAIMSSATGAPRMPTWAAIWSQPATPMGPRKPFLPARMAKMMKTRTAPMSAPISGLANRRRSGPSERRRLGAAPVA